MPPNLLPLHPPAPLPRVAVIGSGIAGLGAAWTLKDHAHVTLFEAGDHFGGHTHTVDVDLPGTPPFAVDTGFLVCNERTYPRLLSLFAALDVPLAPSDMSFSVQAPLPGGRVLEWSGSNLDTVFAQRRNLARPDFWRLLRDILRFNRQGTRLARDPASANALARLTVGEFLRREGYGHAFTHHYLLPMAGCIWSCPPGQMLQFPLLTLLRFCDNHGLLQVTGRPRWFTVRGGARQYVQRIVAALPDARLRTPVRRVQRHDGWVELHTPEGAMSFDQVVIATHSDQALALLADADAAERQVLGTLRTHDNLAVLHTDASVLPRCRAAWAAWNYERAARDDSERGHVCLHYLINRLQPLPWPQPVIVSLNPVRNIEPRHVIGQWHYAHPVYDLAAVAAQRALPGIQGRRHTWFCGAWTGYGFHEDGLRSGLSVAGALLRRYGGASAVARAVAPNPPTPATA